MKRNEQGSVISIVLIIVLLAVIGGIGYFVFDSQRKDSPVLTQDTAQKSSESTDSKKSASWKEVDFAVQGTFADADVVQVDDSTWRMYYATQPEVQGHNFEVYSSVSKDGKTWTKEAGNRKTMATFPSVIKLKDGRYRMYYQNAAVIKSAISTDGLAFTDEAGTRIDTVNDLGLKFDNVAAPTVMQQADGTFVMVYRGSINERYAEKVPNPSTNILLWATSTDGLTFTKKGMAVDSRNNELNGQLDGPDFVTEDDGTVRIYATSYTGVYSFDFDGKTFTNTTLAFAGEAKKDAMGFHGAPPGDPTLAKIGGTWFMYYGEAGAAGGILYATK